MYNEGISVAGNLLDVGVDWASSARAAPSSIYEQRLGQGRENAKDFLKHNPEMMQLIKDRITSASPELSGRVAFAGTGTELATDDEELETE